MSHFFYIQNLQMAPQFRIVRQEQPTNTAVLEKAAATEIDPFSFVSLDANWLAIKATAATTNLLPCIAVLSDTKILVSIDASAVLEMTADAVFAKNMRNTEIDIAIDWDWNQLADVGASATDVLKVLGTEDAWVVWVAKVKVKINRPICA